MPLIGGEDHLSDDTVLVHVQSFHVERVVLVGVGAFQGGRLILVVVVPEPFRRLFQHEEP